jgi:hypothetical protein
MGRGSALSGDRGTQVQVQSSSSPSGSPRTRASPGRSARARLAIAAWIVLVAVSLADHAVDISARIERRQVLGSLISDYGRTA